ncbi:putative metallopeptidase [Clostridium beijerinckii]|uniref:Metallopeptidase n=1 Tax=Clostridium beijerinckii TaxID=1520 RepID=A0AAE5LRF2_CLOBE|nr:putative metallopeptidase [Clostridium beijerinckii]NRT34017.1 putative metallopeptidase [Clostridium beijerinckii]NRT46553.1 putative metallopeptidase [Clostridium beijerinckii]NRZ19442.1 putative metallopeptidase [Clostridium beijerinckii]NSB15936.1 putative metallopeptidase [Clostridium beijerinckii]OOM33265.1 hypothetical protein CLOBE_06030 [Clostridium beijerinckii]
MFKISIIDQESGELVEDINASEYNIQWTHHEDAGRIHHSIALNNAKYGEKCWIKNYVYAPIARRLVSKFEELEGVIVEEILFIEDMEWEPGGAKYNWKARIKRANKDLTEYLGYKYIIETRNYYTSHMDIERLILLIYHELLHIDISDDSIRKHNIEDWSNIVATFGREWSDTKSTLKNILDDDFEEWEKLLRTEKQISLFDNLGVIDFKSIAR